jgi:alkanesulfonate monooxygenase SsuD/methylene tetrahydromethanopterin reductase-like flavin-dependent oxidoreductase (luciferase family)
MAAIKDRQPTPRDFINITRRGKLPPPWVGSPKDVADKFEEWFTRRACDGFVVGAASVPTSYADFAKWVVPELQRRGLFHKDYAGATLRENLGLPRPKSSPR